MRTDCISAASMASHSNGQRMNFKGLWGESYFTHTQNLYGNEMECDYYEVPYHPCADETKAEIREQILKKQKELEEELEFIKKEKKKEKEERQKELGNT